MAGARGEGHLQLAEGERAILFTNRALADAERLTGKTVLQIAGAAAQNALGIGDTAVLLQVGMEQARSDLNRGGKPYTLADAYAVLDEVGFAATLAAVIEGVAAVLSWEQPHEGTERPPA